MVAREEGLSNCCNSEWTNDTKGLNMPHCSLDTLTTEMLTVEKKEVEDLRS